MQLIFAVPVLVGLLLIAGSLLVFRRDKLPPKQFGLAIVISLVFIISPFVYMILNTVKQFFGIVYTFVLFFALSIMGLFALVVYLILVIGNLKQHNETLWQEIALMETELEELKDEI